MFCGSLRCGDCTLLLAERPGIELISSVAGARVGSQHNAMMAAQRYDRSTMMAAQRYDRSTMMAAQRYDRSTMIAAQRYDRSAQERTVKLWHKRMEPSFN